MTRVSSLLAVLAGVLCATTVIAPTGVAAGGAADSLPPLPFTQPQVDLFTTYATKLDTGAWSVLARGVEYLELPDFNLARAAFKILYDQALTEEDKKRIDERVAPFVAKGKGDRSVRLRATATGQTVSLNRKTTSDGRFEERVVIGAGTNADGSPKLRDGDVVDLRTAYKISGGAEFMGLATLLGPTGFSVISDIDDTIKITEVNDSRKALARTFIKESEAVSGMSAFYRQLKSKLSNNGSTSVGFHYVTGSPSQLFDPLTKFLSAYGFPTGSLDMTRLVFTDIQSILSVAGGTLEYKIERLSALLTAFERRKFVFVGDSTQKDPEAYATAARAKPESLQCIFIRKVAGVDTAKEVELNSPERFAKAFVGVDPAKWYVFSDPSELVNLDVAKGQCRP